MDKFSDKFFACCQHKTGADGTELLGVDDTQFDQRDAEAGYGDSPDRFAPDSDDPLVRLSSGRSQEGDRGYGVGALDVDDSNRKVFKMDSASSSASSAAGSSSAAAGSASPKKEVAAAEGEPQDSVWDALTKLTSAGSVVQEDNVLASPSDEANPETATASVSPRGPKAAAASEDELSNELANLEIPSLANLGKSSASSSSAQPETEVATSGSLDNSKTKEQPAVAHQSDALDKIEAMRQNNPVVASNLRVSAYDVSEMMPNSDKKILLADAAERKANIAFQRLNKELTQDALDTMTDGMAKFPLSKDRLTVVLEESQGARLTCAQLRTMIEMVSLDNHKKQVICERYAQVSDKDRFLEEVLNNFTRSQALKAMLMKDLSKSLIEDKGNVLGSQATV